MPLIKLFDAKAAEELESRGFSYMKERTADGKDLYVFAESEELLDALDTLTFAEYSEIVVVRDTVLSF